MFQGNWTCSSCGTEITELPFEPKTTDNLKCKDCHQKQRAENGQGGDRQDRKMYSGNWTCSGCGGAITELPFEPRDTSNLMCRDCFKKQKGG